MVGGQPEVLGVDNTQVHTFDLEHFSQTDITDPTRLLAESEVVMINQHINWIQCLFGCEQRNIYDVYTIHQGKTVRFLRSAEESACCTRCCCPTHCRSFVLPIKYIGNMAGEIDDDTANAPHVAVMNRPWFCTCYCFNFPEMSVSMAMGGSQNNHLGMVHSKVCHPFTCCTVTFHVNNSTGMLYTIEGACSQCGICCEPHCGRCCETILNIYRGSDITSQPCGSFVKQSQCFNSYCTNSDAFLINFPKGCSVEDKLLLISTAMMVQYIYFEDNGRRCRGWGTSLLWI